MTSQNRQNSVSKIYKKQHPSEPLELGPEEYRNEVSQAAREIVSGIKRTIRPTMSSTTGQQADTQQENTSEPPTFDNKNKYLVRKKAQVVVANIINTVNPTAKPRKPSEIGSNQDSEADGQVDSGQDSEADGQVDEFGTKGEKGDGLGVKPEDGELSDRMEYLARPKRGVLYQDGFECPDGAIPEKHLPSWRYLPLHNKIPADQYPYRIDMGEVSEKLVVPPMPYEDFDLSDILPHVYYNSLLDPTLKEYLSRKGVQHLLKKSGQVTESGRLVCTLKQLNEYREYLATLQARGIQRKLKLEHEEEKRQKEKKRKEAAAKRQEERDKEKTQTALRMEVRNAVTQSEKDLMASQVERDKKVINRNIELKKKLKQQAIERQERFEKLYEKRNNFKMEKERKRKESELQMAKRDVERTEEICRRKEEEKKERRRKLVEFWDRKAAHQEKWMEKGMELEEKWQQKKEERVKARNEQVWQARMEAESAMGGKIAEEKEDPNSKLSSSSANNGSDTDSKGDPSKDSSEKTPSPSKKMTLEDILKNDNQTKKSKSQDILRGNPSREEVVQPVPAHVMTLEQMMKNEADGHSTTEEQGEELGVITTFSEATLHRADSDGTTDLTSPEETIVGPWYKGAAQRTSSEEETLGQLLKGATHLPSTNKTMNRDSTKETSDRGSEKETADRGLTHETSDRGSEKETDDRGLTHETSDLGSLRDIANRGLTQETSDSGLEKENVDRGLTQETSDRGSEKETIVYTKTKKKEYFSKEKPPTSSDETTD